MSSSFSDNSFSFLNFLSKRLSRQLEPGVVVIAHLHPEPFSPLIWDCQKKQSLLLESWEKQAGKARYMQKQCLHMFSNNFTYFQMLIFGFYGAWILRRLGTVTSVKRYYVYRTMSQGAKYSKIIFQYKFIFCSVPLKLPCIRFVSPS